MSAETRCASLAGHERNQSLMVSTRTRATP
ncbi:hypothetical protein SAMN05519104_6553 [Rhizobiales bacterium GAS188]|nr:hypothetical protein SAMN05519104_6553 [Rhizobiales bacterium GAS188]